MMKGGRVYPMHNALAMEEGHGRGNFQGGHCHSAQICHASCGAAAGSEPALLYCTLHATHPHTVDEFQRGKDGGKRGRGRLCLQCILMHHSLRLPMFFHWGRVSGGGRRLLHRILNHSLNQAMWSLCSAPTTKREGSSQHRAFSSVPLKEVVVSAVPSQTDIP